MEVVALLQRALQLQVFFFRLVPRNRRTNVGQQFLVVPRLLDKVLSARPNRLYNVVNRAVRRNHDHGQLGLALLDLRQQLQTALSRQSQIKQHQVEVLQLKHAQALFAVVRHPHRIALESQQHLQRFADARFVVDYKNAGRTSGSAGVAIRSRRRDGQVQGQVDLRHGLNSSGVETPGETLCRRPLRFPRESCRRALE